jgi:hypothetical protein
MAAVNAGAAEIRALRAEVAELAALTRTLADSLGAIARRRALDEAVIEAERDRAVAEDRAARPAARRRREPLARVQGVKPALRAVR